MTHCTNCFLLPCLEKKNYHNISLVLEKGNWPVKAHKGTYRCNFDPSNSIQFLSHWTFKDIRNNQAANKKLLIASSHHNNIILNFKCQKGKYWRAYRKSEASFRSSEIFHEARFGSFVTNIHLVHAVKLPVQQYPSVLKNESIYFKNCLRQVSWHYPIKAALARNNYNK